MEFQEKTIPGEFFRNFVQNTGYPLPELVKFGPNLCNFILGLYCAEKKFTKALSNVVCTHERRHVHKRITTGRYGEEKPERFVLGKPVFLTPGLGLTTPYSLGILD